MVLNRDREALAEEWHNLLCLLDPAHPECVPRMGRARGGVVWGG
jgi:hypothetical protein